MRTATAPSVITATPFGGYTCFYGDPIIDPQGTGIAWFNNDDTNNVPTPLAHHDCTAASLLALRAHVALSSLGLRHQH
jgi:hypothetical protein